jgi:hypothetical protein
MLTASSFGASGFGEDASWSGATAVAAVTGSFAAGIEGAADPVRKVSVSALAGWDC